MMSSEQRQQHAEITRKVATAMDKLKDKSKVAAELGISISSVRRHLRRSNGKATPASPQAQKQVGRSLADFRASHDKSFIIPQKIKEGLKLLGHGWEYEMQFAHLCGVSQSDLGNYREMFADHFIVIGRSGKRAWAGSRETAEKMRAMV